MDRMPSGPAKNHSHSDMVVILVAFHITVLHASLKPFFFMNLSLIVSLFDPIPVMDKAISGPSQMASLSCTLSFGTPTNKFQVRVQHSVMA